MKFSGINRRNKIDANRTNICLVTEKDNKYHIFDKINTTIKQLSTIKIFKSE